MDPFATRQLGRSGVRLTQLGFGGGPIGSLFGFIDDEQGKSVVRAAYEMGVRYFDTAPLYGTGSSERRVGAGLAEYPRDSFVLSTKVGRLLVRADGAGGKLAHFKDREPFRPVFDYSGDGIRRSVEESLERLGLDRIDILYVHDPQGTLYDVLDHSYPALDRMRREGIVKAIGCGVNFSEVCQILLRFADWDCFLLALRYNLLEQTPLAEFFPLCEERGVGIVVGAALHSGILAGGAVEGARFNYRPAPPEIMERVRRIERVCAEYGVPLQAAALQFPLGHPVVASVITGSRHPERMRQMADMMRVEIPPAFWGALKAARLLPDHAPVPA
jgi:D-threo-aldose 1-dehydrogenase